jgi:hypothetical protein
MMKGGNAQSGAGKPNLEPHKLTSLSPQLHISSSVLSHSNQPFSQFIRDSTSTVNQSLTMSIAPPSLEFILHDGETGRVSRLPIDCSVFDLDLRDSIEIHPKDDEYGTLEVEHKLDNDEIKDIPQFIGPNSWLEVSIKGQEPQIVIPGGHADFEQTENGLEFVQGYPGDAGTVIAFTDEQEKRYERQTGEYDRQVEGTRQLMDTHSRRMKSSSQQTAVPEEMTSAQPVMSSISKEA